MSIIDQIFDFKKGLGLLRDFLEKGLGLSRAPTPFYQKVSHFCETF